MGVGATRGVDTANFMGILSLSPFRNRSIDQFEGFSILVIFEDLVFFFGQSQVYYGSSVKVQIKDFISRPFLRGAKMKINLKKQKTVMKIKTFIYSLLQNGGKIKMFFIFIFYHTS